jgi:hypothetical protein
MLQNSKVATSRIFGENLKREEVDDSYSLSRATEVAHEFSVKRRGPSDLNTKTAPAARGIFDHLCKTTFATVSAMTRLIHRSKKYLIRSPRRLGPAMPVRSSGRALAPFSY